MTRVLTHDLWGGHHGLHNVGKGYNQGHLTEVPVSRFGLAVRR